MKGKGKGMFVLSKRRQLGVVAIEFAMGSVLMFLATIGIFEISRLTYIITLVESALRESSRDTRVWADENTGAGYDERLQEMFDVHSNALNLLVDHDAYEFDTIYFNSLADMVKHKSNDRRGPVAIYTITYQYTPMFVLPGVINSKIIRHMLVTMEHE